MKKLMTMTLTGKLTVGGIIAVLLPVVCVGIFSAMKSGAELEAVSRAQVQTTALALADMIQLSLTQEMNVAKGISIGSDAVELATRVAKEGMESSARQIENFQHKLANMRAHIGRNYEAMVLINQEGKVFADSENGELRGLDTADRDYFKDALKGKDTVGSPSPSKATGNPIIALAAPVLSRNNEVVGVVAIVAKIDFLGEKVAGTKQGRSGYACVVDAGGTIIAHPARDQVLRTNIAKLPGMESVAKSILAGETGEQD